MKLHHSPQNDLNIIKAYTDDSVTINEEVFRQSIVVQANAINREWAPQSIDELNASHIDELAELDTEIILLGTGSTQQFPDRRLFIPLYNRKIGIEIMDTPAACRTYNILLEQDRAVTAALLMS